MEQVDYNWQRLDQDNCQKGAEESAKGAFENAPLAELALPVSRVFLYLATFESRA